MDKVDLLARVPLFASVPRADLERIARLTEDVEVGAGTVLTREGRYESAFYFVVAGTVEIVRGDRPVDTVHGGGFFGEIALLDAGPRTATATALTPCELLRFNNREFDALLDTMPAVREAIQQEAEGRLARIDAEARPPG